MSDEVGRLREYVSGDRLSRVSWPTTARTGTMHVRDAIVEEQTEVAMVIDLGFYEAFARRVGEHCPTHQCARSGRNVGRSLLEAGSVIRLITVEQPAEYFDAEAAQAAQRPGVDLPAINPLDYPTILRDEMVVDHEALSRRLSRAEVGSVDRPEPPYVLVTLGGAKVIE